MAADSYRELVQAVEVVQRDAERILGHGAVAFSDTPPFESDLPRIAGFPTPDLWLFVNDEPGATGLNASPGEPWPHLLARVAETVQEVIIESQRNWGAAFPPCPLHPGSPLWPSIVEEEAVWTCIDGGGIAVVIGEWPPQPTS